MKERWWSDTKEGEDISSCARDPSRQLCLVSYVSFLLPSSVPSLTAMCINIAVRLSHPPTRESIIDSCYYLNLPIEMEPSLAPLPISLQPWQLWPNYQALFKLTSLLAVQFRTERSHTITVRPRQPIQPTHPHTHLSRASILEAWNLPFIFGWPYLLCALFKRFGGDTYELN